MAMKDRGHPGNKYPEKFKTPEARQGVFKLFCDHLAGGFSARTFHTPCVENTIWKMLKSYPDEFDLEVLESARAKGQFIWEEMGKAGTAGDLKGFNATSWWRIMQNKLGWKDRMEHAADPVNPLVVGSGQATLSPADRATLDHFKEKLLYENKYQGGVDKGEKPSKKSPSKN